MGIMIIHPTRTNLLLLKEKAKSVNNSVGNLKARRQALIQEFLKTTLPFLRSREDISKIYGKAIHELILSSRQDSKTVITSLTFSTERDIRINITERSIWGLNYKDITVEDQPVREPDQRGYDLRSTGPHVEECIYHFEKILESMIELAAFESKLKRLSDEIVKIMRKIKVLEEKVVPEVTGQMKRIAQYIAEREREAYYRLKKFKG